MHAYHVDTAKGESMMQAGQQVIVPSTPSMGSCNTVSLPNGTVRRVYQDGRTVIQFPNGDHKRSFPDREAQLVLTLMMSRHFVYTEMALVRQHTSV